MDENRIPNIIYVTCVGTYGEERLVIADNYFNKTRHDSMKKWNPSKHPGHAALAISIEEVFSGAERLL